MNHVFKILCALLIVSAASYSAYAVDVESSVSTSDNSVAPERKALVISELESLEDAFANELTDARDEVGYAILKTTVQRVHDIMKRAVDYVNDVLLSTELTTEQKGKAIDEVMPKLGNVLFGTLRFHKEDTINKDEDMLAAIKDISTAEMVLTEFGLDATAFTTMSRARNGQAIYTPFNRSNRDDLAQFLIGQMQRIGTEGVRNMSDAERDLALKTRRFIINKIVNTGGQMRQGRLKAQRITALTYLGFAVWGILAPHVDVIGLVEGRSENSLFASSVIYFSFWSSIAILKMSSYSDATARMIQEMKNIFLNPSLEPQVDKEKFFTRVFKNMKGAIGCGDILNFTSEYTEGKPAAAN